MNTIETKDEAMKISLGAQKILNTIKKVENNPQDAAHGKNQIEIYFDPTKEDIRDLKALGYKVKDRVVSWE